MRPLSISFEIIISSGLFPEEVEQILDSSALACGVGFVGIGGGTGSVSGLAHLETDTGTVIAVKDRGHAGGKLIAGKLYYGGEE